MILVAHSGNYIKIGKNCMINEHMKPWTITQEELNLRFDYAEGRITLERFKRRYKKLKRQGKIKRNGKVIK